MAHAAFSANVFAYLEHRRVSHRGSYHRGDRSGGLRSAQQVQRNDPSVGGPVVLDCDCGFRGYILHPVTDEHVTWRGTLAMRQDTADSLLFLIFIAVVLGVGIGYFLMRAWLDDTRREQDKQERLKRFDYDDEDD